MHYNRLHCISSSAHCPNRCAAVRRAPPQIFCMKQISQNCAAPSDTGHRNRTGTFQKKCEPVHRHRKNIFTEHDNPHGAHQDSSDFHTFFKFFDVDTKLFWHLCGDMSQYSHADEQSACVGARRASTHFFDSCTETLRFHWEVKSRRKNHDGANQDSVVIHTFWRICRCWRKSLMTCLQK